MLIVKALKLQQSTVFSMLSISIAKINGNGNFNSNGNFNGKNQYQF
jgi:hypothetical protein